MIRQTIHQLSAAIGAAALTVAVAVPLVCLLLTPGDAHAAYRIVYEAFFVSLPELSLTCARFPKVAVLAGWLAVVAFQFWACFRARPRWWLRPLQAALAAASVPLFLDWHIGSVSLPMAKMLNVFAA